MSRQIWKSSMQRYTQISFFRRVRRTGIPKTEVKTFMKNVDILTYFILTSVLCDFWFSENETRLTFFPKPTTDDTNQYHWLGVTTSGVTSIRKKELTRGSIYSGEEKKNQQWEQTTSREGCNHFNYFFILT